MRLPIHIQLKIVMLLFLCSSYSNLQAENLHIEKWYFIKGTSNEKPIFEKYKIKDSLDHYRQINRQEVEPINGEMRPTSNDPAVDRGLDIGYYIGKTIKEAIRFINPFN